MKAATAPAPVPRSTSLVKLAWPVSMEHMLNMSLLWVDSIIINRILGTEAFAAVNLSGQIINMIGLILIVVAAGASIVIAHQVGAEDRDGAGETAGQSLGAAVLMALALGSFLLLGAAWLLSLLGAEGAVAAQGAVFIRTLAVFLPAQALLAVLGAILRATGNTRGPMKVTLMVNLVNAAITYLLVAGLPAMTLGGWTLPAIGGGMGLFGAALGTNIARTGGLVLMIAMLLRTSGLPIQLARAFRFRVETLWRVARMGVPGAMEFISYQGSQFVLTMLVVPLGTAVIAARGLTFQTESFTFIPVVGLATAASILVGQHMGAGRRDEAVGTGRRALLYGGAGIGVLAVLLFLFPRQLASIFTKDPEVIEYAAITLRISAAYKLGQMVNIVAGGIFRGAGNPTWPTGLTTVGTWTITVPLSYLAVKLGYGLPGVLWAMFIDEVIRGSVNLWYFTTPHWRFRRV